jgi:hypothetical protein
LNYNKYNEDYKIYIFYDVIIFELIINKNNKNIKEKNIIIFIPFITIIEKSFNVEIKLEIINENLKSIMNLTFSNEDERNEFKDIILTQIEQQKNRLLNKGIIFILFLKIIK